MYFETEAWEISIPSLSSSPWMRGAPQPTFADCISRMRIRISLSIGGRPTCRRRLFQRQYRRKPSRCQRTTVSGCNMCNITRHSFTYFENNTQNKRSAAETRGRFTEGLSIVSCWRSAIFSSANWRRDWKREQTVVSTASKRLGMPVMLQQTQKNVNDFRPLRFTGGTGAFCYI